MATYEIASINISIHGRKMVKYRESQASLVESLQMQEIGGMNNPAIENP
jgi:hypothetical protein